MMITTMMTKRKIDAKRRSTVILDLIGKTYETPLIRRTSYWWTAIHCARLRNSPAKRSLSVITSDVRF
jgi:hypothetical protein